MNALQKVHEAKGYLALSAVFVLGLLGGIWAVLAPFVTKWPLPASGAWTHPIWASVIVGVVLMIVSGAAIVVTTGLAVRAAAGAKALAAEELA
ncbi:MAG: hypothetical protein ACREQM_18955 [Candidatus Dormibacteraceae bacterium]